jgi:hypothetical protein
MTLPSTWTSFWSSSGASHLVVGVGRRPTSKSRRLLKRTMSFGLTFFALLLTSLGADLA